MNFIGHRRKGHVHIDRSFAVTRADAKRFVFVQQHGAIGLDPPSGRYQRADALFVHSARLHRQMLDRTASIRFRPKIDAIDFAVRHPHRSLVNVIFRATFARRLHRILTSHRFATGADQRMDDRFFAAAEDVSKQQFVASDQRNRLIVGDPLGGSGR